MHTIMFAYESVEMSKKCFISNRYVENHCVCKSFIQFDWWNAAKSLHFRCTFFIFLSFINGSNCNFYTIEDSMDNKKKTKAKKSIYRPSQKASLYSFFNFIKKKTFLLAIQFTYYENSKIKSKYAFMMVFNNLQEPGHKLEILQLYDIDDDYYYNYWYHIIKRREYMLCIKVIKHKINQKLKT